MKKVQVRTNEEWFLYTNGYNRAFEELKRVNFVRHLSSDTDTLFSRHFIDGWNQSLHDYRNTIKQIKAL